MKVPFLDLKSAYTELSAEIDYAVSNVLSSGQYILGPTVEAFEAEFRTYAGANFAIGVGSGLDALVISLKALGIGPGDDVIVPSNTFIATWMAVTLCGATVVPVEPSWTTRNLDISLVEAAINPRTKAVIAVHLYGQPADIRPLLEIAYRHNLKVIEDAAQAHGAKYEDCIVGAHSDAVAWSFYPGKNLGAVGDGGAVTCNNAQLAANVSLLRNYGSPSKYKHDVVGLNSRLDPLQAAVLSVKLKHLERWNQTRKDVALRYLREITNENVSLPFVPHYSEPVWHLFVLQHDHRDELQENLRRVGVETLIHYPTPPHMQHAYNDSFLRDDFPIALRLSETALSLPIGPHMQERQVDQVIEMVNRYA